ncbi:TrbI/VirB10 family protein [Paraburkholderia sp. BL23I1N1]|uniref:TrbI/VirB10 family protein n=1 Tax=Paraburkholderia sp. BL23I1N1 TaxID=1938802 RepID=UPI000E723D1E|nr:TrbI/VirB10 family protein [Paraburkholderia sp. BL23I1N1]
MRSSTTCRSCRCQLSQPQATNGENYSSQQIVASSLGLQLGQLGMQLAQRGLDIQPTLEIRPGYRFNIMVTKDVVTGYGCASCSACRPGSSRPPTSGAAGRGSGSARFHTKTGGLTRSLPQNMGQSSQTGHPDSLIGRIRPAALPRLRGRPSQ